MTGSRGLVRAIHVERGKGYEPISRSTLQIRRLSYKARGILSYLKSMPNDWETSTEAIAADSDCDGYESVNNGLKELEREGLLARLKRQGGGGKWEWLWVYSDDPEAVSEAVDKWYAKYGVTPSPRGGNRQAKGRPDQREQVPPDADPDLQEPDETMSGKPEHGEATVFGKPVHGLSVDGSPVHGKPPNKEIYSTDLRTPNPSLAAGDPPPLNGYPQAQAAALTRERCTHGSVSCRACGTSPRAARQAEVERAEAAALVATRACGMCNPDGWRINPATRVPVTPWLRCDHSTPHVDAVAHLDPSGPAEPSRAPTRPPTQRQAPPRPRSHVRQARGSPEQRTAARAELDAARPSPDPIPEPVSEEPSP